MRLSSQKTAAHTAAVLWWLWKRVPTIEFGIDVGAETRPDQTTDGAVEDVHATPSASDAEGLRKPDSPQECGSLAGLGHGHQPTTTAVGVVLFLQQRGPGTPWHMCIAAGVRARNLVVLDARRFRAQSIAALRTATVMATEQAQKSINQPTEQLAVEINEVPTVEVRSSSDPRRMDAETADVDVHGLGAGVTIDEMLAHLAAERLSMRLSTLLSRPPNPRVLRSGLSEVFVCVAKISA
ncbi:uncharacterized protein GGS25DRAFT_523277 [Hypoxylon fragiforme]|uniref:uncharacterized protein n=1 Tax=Hypoxylon fragiforme TaxID=63214 RepID=UPI0020C6141D|nr:uncharacterized protein GGS25DRAFT_523277 [Hypoxylon fragiforme]KAI2607750.1 hypothetical protein GGS25DRAFT_523277 [Hypoxylon fragiforme]